MLRMQDAGSAGGAGALPCVLVGGTTVREDGDAFDVRLTVNGALSLDEARRHYARCGAAHPRFVPHVRKPLSAEL